MERKILIPTDFTIESLNTVKYALEKNTDAQVKIVLLSGVYLPGSITEMLFYSQSETLGEMVGADFAEACKIIRNKHQSKLVSIEPDLFSGHTRSALSNYIKANAIDEIYVPKSYSLKRVHKRSFNCVPLMYKAGIPLTEVDWVVKTDVPEKDMLAELFTRLDMA